MVDVDTKKTEPPKVLTPGDHTDDKAGTKDKTDNLSARVHSEQTPADTRAATEAERKRASTATLASLEITDAQSPNAVAKIADSNSARSAEKEVAEHSRRQLNTREEQDAYWQERVDAVGVHKFKKINGDYGITPVTAETYPKGLTLSYTDGKIKMEQDLKLPNGGIIKAGQELPAGIRLYQNAKEKWEMQLPQGNTIALGDDVKFSGGQKVDPGRVILSRPSIDEKGHLNIDTYTQSPEEIKKFYHSDGANRVKLNQEVQTERTMVPIDPKDPIVMKSYDGATMDHSGNAWLVKIPPNYGGGYYIVAEKDLMPLFDGTEPKAIAAKKQFDSDLAQKVVEENTAKATNVDYKKREEQVSLPLDAKEYMKVQPVEGEILTQPTPWANRYGVKDGVVPVDIAMPGDLKIFENAGVKSDWYVAPKEFADGNYKEVAPGEYIKTTPFLAEQLSRPDTANGFSGVKGDYLVTPIGKKGEALTDKQYIVEREKFEHFNAPRDQVEDALRHGIKPVSISAAAEEEQARKAEPPQSAPKEKIFKPSTTFQSSSDEVQLHFPGFEGHRLPPAAVVAAMERKAHERTPEQDRTVDTYLDTLGKNPSETRAIKDRINEAVGRGLTGAAALTLALGLASSAFAESAKNSDSVTFAH